MAARPQDRSLCPLSDERLQRMSVGERAWGQRRETTHSSPADGSRPQSEAEPERPAQRAPGGEQWLVSPERWHARVAAFVLVVEVVGKVTPPCRTLRPRRPMDRER